MTPAQFFSFKSKKCSQQKINPPTYKSNGVSLMVFQPWSTDIHHSAPVYCSTIEALMTTIVGFDVLAS